MQLLLAYIQVNGTGFDKVIFSYVNIEIELFEFHPFFIPSSDTSHVTSPNFKLVASFPLLLLQICLCFMSAYEHTHTHTMLHPFFAVCV